MVQLNFNANDHAPQGSFTVYPSGVYDVMINGSELKETKAKKAGTSQRGAYLQLNLRIVSGTHAGGTLIDRVNIENDNSTAEEIGQAQMSAICRVVGVMQLQDSQQLHGIPFKVEVAEVERNDKPGTMSNEIKGYQDINGNGPESAGQGATQQQQPQQQQQPVQQQQQPQQQPAQQQQQQPWQQQQAPVEQQQQQQQPVQQQQQQQQQQPVQQQQQPVQQQQPAQNNGGAGAPPPWAQNQG